MEKIVNLRHRLGWWYYFLRLRLVRQDTFPNNFHDVLLEELPLCFIIGLFRHHNKVLLALAHFERSKCICVSSLVLFIALLVVEAAIVVHSNDLALMLAVEGAA